MKKILHTKVQCEGFWGIIDGNGTLYRAALNGYGWSSTANSRTSGAFVLFFTASYVVPSVSYIRYLGSPVRCLAD